MMENEDSKGKPGPKSSEAERARLRRNQRNSRARKQAYIEDLEQRWNVCLKAGARATEEMQKEARRVHEENLVLRALLRERGIDDDHIVRVLSSTGRSPAKLNLDARSDCCGPGQSCPVPTTQITEPPAAMSQKGSVVSQTPPDQQLPLPKDSPISWDLYGWLNDLSQIKDAFGTGNEEEKTDPTSQAEDNIPLQPSNFSPFPNVPPIPQDMPYPNGYGYWPPQTIPFDATGNIPNSVGEPWPNYSGINPI